MRLKALEMSRRPLPLVHWPPSLPVDWPRRKVDKNARRQCLENAGIVIQKILFRHVSTKNARNGSCKWSHTLGQIDDIQKEDLSTQLFDIRILSWFYLWLARRIAGIGTLRVTCLVRRCFEKRLWSCSKQVDTLLTQLLKASHNYLPNKMLWHHTA